MKPYLKLGCCLLLLLNLGACGKKAQEKEKITEASPRPSNAEMYFNTVVDMETAVETNDLEKLQRALSANIEVDLDLMTKRGETFLIMAVKEDYVEIRDLLIDEGCSLEKANINGETPLIAAVSNNRLNSVRVLLDRKVELNKKRNDGDTALHVAIKNKNEEAALLLIKSGANLVITDNSHKNALGLAQDVQLPELAEFIRSLMQVDLGAPDVTSFRNILSQADFSALKSIMARYPHIASDYEVINPLALLVEAKDENQAFSSAELLLRNKANVNGPKDAEITPLIKATISRKKNFAELYLRADANPQLLDKDGKSALIHAIELNNVEIVEMLLERSAVEKYTFRREGTKITYDACKTARAMSKKLTNPEEKEINQQIRDALGCGFFFWPF